MLRSDLLILVAFLAVCWGLVCLSWIGWKYANGEIQ